MNRRAVVITRNDSGDVRVDVTDTDTIEKRINEGYWGSKIQWATHGDGDPQYWPGEVAGMIIVGVPADPRATEKVTKWEIP